MRRFFILSLLLTVAACQEKDSLKVGGDNPLSECVISSNARPGQEAVVQWNGFGSSPVLFLRSADGKEYPVGISVVTASGLIFHVPAGIMSGTYSVVMDDGDRVELGTIEILAVDMPVTAVSLPHAVEAGKDFVIKGVGFTDEHLLKLVHGTDVTVLEFETISSGVKVTLPADIDRTVYSLYLSDGMDEWLLSDSFAVALRKRLASVSRYAPVDGAVRYRTCYALEYDADVFKAIVYTASQVENGEVLLEEAHDRYLLGQDGVFRAEGGQSTSLNIEFGYDRDSEGRILAADVLRFSRNNPEGAMRRFSWKYDSEGRPTDATFELDGVTRSLQVWLYEGENLSETMFSVFVYDDNSLKNNPFALDVATGYDMMSMLDEPFLYAPYLMGDIPFVQTHLPSAIMEPSGMMGTLVRKDVVYQYDEDGYATQMSWNNGSDMLVFEYL